MIDVIAGTLDLIFEGSAVAISHAKAGKVRPLAVTSSQRLPQLPDVPTFAELGLPGVTHYFWIGLLAATGTPQAAIDRLAAATREAVFRTDLHDRFIADGLEPMQQTPEEFTALIHAEVTQMLAIAQELGLAKQ
jgi:tripartite-type tricarboxylate transporter receptor subunit TctC